MLLRDVLPSEFHYEYLDTQAAKFLDVEVEKSCDATNPTERWPGSQRNVYAWWILKNGKAVGWNENPGRGWSFPVISYKR